MNKKIRAVLQCNHGLMLNVHIKSGNYMYPGTLPMLSRDYICMLMTKTTIVHPMDRISKSFPLLFLRLQDLQQDAATIVDGRYHQFNQIYIHLQKNDTSFVF